MHMNGRESPGCLGLRGWAAVILLLITLWFLYYVIDVSFFPPVGRIGVNVLLYTMVTIFFSAVFFPLLIAWPSFALGLLWAPFGALVCARMAQSRGLNRRRYAVAGAVYSILFLWPWIYLIARMHNKGVPGLPVRAAYIILYCIVWPLATLSVVLPALGAEPLRPFLLVVLPSVLTWFLSLKNLIGWGRSNWQRSNDPSDGVMPERVYIMPFAYAFVWTLFAGAAWGATYFVEPELLSDSIR